jgi:GntR family negative regulator for fad regulon and positive regulator of fabA
MNLTQPFRPGQFAEQQIIESILDGRYPPGSPLPAERKLAEKLGVTRPTIREALQRLASEGWVTIRHGKPTEVNYFWEQGGLRLLGTLVKYGNFLPAAFIEHLLDLRVILNPPIARQASENAPEIIIDHLKRCLLLDNDPDAFTEYDMPSRNTTGSCNSFWPGIRETRFT